MSDHINQSEVEFLPRYLMHSISEHRIYFYSEKVSNSSLYIHIFTPI